MKLIGMHVDDFGGLHNYDYTFEDGLNVILQDNGWGKTTMAAFLKAMLYGFDSKRSKDVTENERKRYLPWHGGKYGGSLDFEAEGARYRIFRTFGETPRFDRTRIINLDSNTTARINPDKIGETLFKLDASAFQRSVFINQNGLGIEGASSSIHARLNSLVSQANDVAAYDDAIAELNAQIKIYEKKGNRGQLGDITRQIAALESQREQLEADISAQDSARERISEIDMLLSSINKDLEDKKRRLEEVSGESKKREASIKHLDEVNAQLSELLQRMDAIRAELGNHIPGNSDIDQVKRQKQAVISLTAQLGDLENNHGKLTADYNDFLERYKGEFPKTSQLDEIQSIYGELQGILSTDNEDAIADENGLENYVLVKDAVNQDPDYTSKLRAILDNQTTLQQLVRKSEAKEREIQQERESWENKKKRYKALSEEVENIQPDVDPGSKYRHEAVGPVIAVLEDLQKQQQLADVKNEELDKTALTTNQLDDLSAFSGDIPDAEEGSSILKKFRNITIKQADVQGLNARLEGEKSRADSLKASMAQMDSVPDGNAPAMEKPKKPAGTAIMVAGAALALIGTALIFAVSPIMAAVAAVGVVLAISGAVSNNNYKKKIKEYEAYKATSSQRREAQKKKADLQKQLREAESAISAVENQIRDINIELNNDQESVNEWLSKWRTVEGAVTEETICEVLDKADKARKLRTVQKENEERRRSISERTDYITREWEKAEKDYPKISGKSFSEALGILRSAETDYKIKADKLQTAIRNLDKFLSEEKLSKEQFAEKDSPRIAALSEERNAAEEELNGALNDANKVMEMIGIIVSAENISTAFRKAEQALNEYKQHSDKIKGRADRQQKKGDQIAAMKHKLEEKTIVLQDSYNDIELPERLGLIRKDISGAAKLKEKINEAEIDIRSQKEKLEDASNFVGRFISEYGRFEPETDDILEEIYAKAASYAKLDAARQALEKQRAKANQEQEGEAMPAGAGENELKTQISALEERRDSLRDEYTQKSDFIRQADQSLERYPDVEQEIRQLYNQKQKAQNTLIMLKRTIQLITKAKENLANRYLGRVEDTFNNYMHIWLGNDEVRGILDIDFNITIEEDDKTHVVEGYSTGTCDLIDFCMRLALVDTLFEKEQPFLILDDPFVNLDEEHLDKALELLNVMAANRQLVYFVCHPIRAVKAGANPASGEEFARLAEATRKSIENRKSVGNVKKKTVRRSPREMYHVAAMGSTLPFKPAKTNYTITNNIFSLNFEMNEAAVVKDNSYELFFIDAIGHVLNERQLIEVKNGKLSTERVQFCLNTRDDSGEQYELMIRESGQDDYEIIARIPYKAKLAFAGTISFDF